MKKQIRNLIAIAGSALLVVIIFFACCTVVDSGEVGIKFHKWSVSEQDYGGHVGELMIKMGRGEEALKAMFDAKLKGK